MWKAALPIWKLEMWFRRHVLDSPYPFSERGLGLEDDLEQNTSAPKHQGPAKAFLKLLAACARNHERMSFYSEYPVRTKEVVEDLQRERKRIPAGKRDGDA